MRWPTTYWGVSPSRWPTERCAAPEIVYSAKINGEPTTFGTSGMLYRSNKVMYDRLTNSLWNQLSREPVIGPLWDSGIKLDFFPVMLTTWEEWLELHPDTTVLAQDTGVYHRSFYVPEDDPQAIYFDYFNTPQTMFPVPDRNNWLETKDIVLGVQLNGSYQGLRLLSIATGPHRERRRRWRGHSGAGVGHKRGRAGLLPRRAVVRSRRRTTAVAPASRR